MNPGYSEPSPDEVSTAIPLEIDEETAARADDILREFAEEAGLETALIVDRSGALVSGISAEEEVSVEIISALVAGASGAMRALVLRLGETGTIESFHLGGNRLVYLKEIVNRFILVAVADSSRPAGAVRQKALAIEPRLDLLLLAVTPKEVDPAIRAQPPARSLREIARERTAMREAGVLAVAAVAESLPEGVAEQASLHLDEDPIMEEYPAEVGVDETFETLEWIPDEDIGEEDASGEVALAEVDEAGETKEPGSDQPSPIEPREIHEPLVFGEPEIVVEASEHPAFAPPALPIPVDSPFEAEEEGQEDGGDDFPTRAPEVDGEEWYEIDEEESVDEIEEEVVTEPCPENGIPDEVGGENEDEDASFEVTPPLPGSVFEVDGEEEEGDGDDEGNPVGQVFSGSDDRSPGGMARPDSLFELAEDDDFEEEEEWTPFEAWDGEEDGEEEGDAGDDHVFEIDEEEFDEDEESFEERESPGESDGEVFEEMIAEEESESEIRNSGPFYF